MGLNLGGINLNDPLGGLLGAASGWLSGTIDSVKFNSRVDDLQEKLKAAPADSIKLPADGKPSDLLKFVQNGLNMINGNDVLKADGKPSAELLQAINKYTTDKGGPEITDINQITPLHLREIIKDLREKKILSPDNKDEIKLIMTSLGKALHEVNSPDIKKIAQELSPKKDKPSWGAEADIEGGTVTVASADIKGGYVSFADQVEGARPRHNDAVAAALAGASLALTIQQAAENSSFADEVLPDTVTTLPGAAISDVTVAPISTMPAGNVQPIVIKAPKM